VASVPELPGCHTQAKTQDMLIKRIREAIALCLDVEKENISSSVFVGVQRVTV
jgi:predicted RNase H-like HicB family nuclease